MHLMTEEFYLEVMLNISANDFSVLFQNERMNNIGYVKINKFENWYDFEFHGQRYVLIYEIPEEYMRLSGEAYRYGFYVGFSKYGLDTIPEELMVRNYWDVHDLKALGEASEIPI